MKSNIFIAIAFSVFLLAGCSQVGKVPMPGDIEEDRYRTIVRPAQLDRWNWGNWVFYVNEDHTSIEVVPVRDLNLHYNVLKFVEGFPCPNCLMIGGVQPQGDGTFKVKVILTHPFPGLPKYTGFDVRGTVVFPASHYWTGEDYCILEWGDDGPLEHYYHHMPLHFSRASAGGAEVLNADGYSFYLFPGFPPFPDVPICNYQDGKYATGTQDELDSTINPYIEFHNVEERRMFTCYGQVTRTYHIKPPEGAFKFGYVVDASWEPPINTPVTDPATDFPDYANAEDGYSLGAEQIAPIVKGSHWYDVAEWTIHHRATGPDGPIYKVIVYCPGIPDKKFHGGIDLCYREPNLPGDPEGLGEKVIIDPWTSLIRVELGEDIADDVEPGYHLAILVSMTRSSPNEGPAYFHDSPTIEFIELYVEG